MSERCYDVAVVGAGPAGLSAAVCAAEAGMRVVLVDAAGQAGGQFWRHPDESGPARDEGHGQHLWRRFVDLRSRLRALEGGGTTGRVRRLAGQQVWFVERADDAWSLFLTPTMGRAWAAPGSAIAGAGAPPVVAASLILCPGAYDRQLPVPGWDLPGVMTVGGVQALLKGHRTVAGKRAVIAGTGPFLLPVAVGLAEAGATVVAVCEAGTFTSWAKSPLRAVAVPSKAREAAGYASALARHRIPVRTRTVVTEILGDGAVESVRLGRMDRGGHLRHGGVPVDVDADLVGLGWGFTPSLELVTALGVATRVDADGSLVAVVDDWQRTDARLVYAAGEATGVGGAALALSEGELAGLSAARDAGFAIGARRARSLRGAVRRGRAFAAAMHGAHPVPAGWREWLRPDTTVCRCEEVTLGDLLAARDRLGAADARTVKLLARPGMGWCQGRVCGFATAALAAGPGRPLERSDLEPMARRTLAVPVSLAELAGQTGVNEAE